MLAAPLRSAGNILQLLSHWTPPRSPVLSAIVRMKSKYLNNFTNQEEIFIWPSGFLIFPCGITWIVGAIANHFQIQPKDRTYIPSQKSIICAIIVTISTLTYN